MSEWRRRFALTLLLVIGFLPFELNGWYNPKLTPYQFWVVEIVTWILLPAIIITTAVRARLTTLRDIGLRSDVRSRAPILLAALILLVPIVLIPRFTS